MPDPWDIPPFPTRGDDDQDSTFAGIGRVLSQWEMIEVELSHIYAWLMNRPEEIEVLRQYGDKRIFDKLQMYILAGTHTKRRKAN